MIISFSHVTKIQLPMKFNKKYAVVTILGGFGNQLFQLCFANSLKEKGFKVFINTGVLKKVLNEENPVITRRNLVLPVNYFGFKELNNFQYQLIKTLEKFPFRIFVKKFNENNFEVSQTKTLNLFSGYWQDFRYINENKKFLIEALSKNKKIKESIKFIPFNGSTALHVRRTDYIPLGEELSVDFYINSLNFMKKNVKNFHYSIFTDDINWVKSQNIFSDAKNIYSSKNILDDFSEMLKYENFIVGNSTFSLMAAHIKEGINTKIIIADPWFRNNEYKKLYSEDWVKINNVKP